MTSLPLLPETSSNVSSPYDEAIHIITRAISQLPHQALPELLQFIEFLGYKFGFEDDPLDDEMIWKLIEAEEAYQREHPEDVIVCKTEEELIAVLGGFE